jgi:hypothetical protein
VNPGAGRAYREGQVPLIGRIFPAPLAAKVPEVIFLFWVVKILTTAGGEAMSDYLRTWGNVRGGGAEVLVFLVAVVLQFGTRRYRALAYWSLAYAIAIFGTGVSDFLHLDVHIPYAGTTLFWSVILAAIFWIWQRNEGTLSIHSITTQRREAFYWATVFATFALARRSGISRRPPSTSATWPRVSSSASSSCSQPWHGGGLAWAASRLSGCPMSSRGL